MKGRGLLGVVVCGELNGGIAQSVEAMVVGVVLFLNCPKGVVNCSGGSLSLRLPQKCEQWLRE